MSTSTEVKSIFQSIEIEYISKNDWSGVKKSERNSNEVRARGFVPGTESRLLEGDHPLAGEYGLFAAKKFEMFDVIGEYLGDINQCEGHYCAAVSYSQCKSQEYSVDGGKKGNELRFINDYHNIASGPNVIMKDVHLDTYPCIVIVCVRDIEIGEEILVSYGPNYCSKYLGINPE